MRLSQEAQSLAPPLRPRLRHPLDARNFPHFDSPRHAAGARRAAGARGGGAGGGGPCAEEWEGWDWVSSGRPPQRQPPAPPHQRLGVRT